MRKPPNITVIKTPGALSLKDQSAFFLRLQQALLLGLAGQGKLTPSQLEGCLQALEGTPRDTI